MSEPSLIAIRDYQESDARQIGILIADTYREFNLSFVPPEEIGLFLGPFQHACSTSAEHQERIAAMIHSEMVFVVADDEEIVDVLRGRPTEWAACSCAKTITAGGSGAGRWNISSRLAGKKARR